MTRQEFIGGAFAAAGVTILGCDNLPWPKSGGEIGVGAPYPRWRPGHFQIHMIYTGVGESQFLIFPDGTSMLLDCGDHNAAGFGADAAPILPDSSRHSGEWVARYVQRVNPRGRDVDYMLLTHYHEDHGGSTSFHAGKAPSGRYVLSGFSQTGEFLRFGRAIDRCWPDYADPIPLLPQACVNVMRPFYEELVRRGTKVEKFRLEKGSDQIVPLHGEVDGFRIEPLCANGRILLPDGRVHDPLKDYFAATRPKTFNENGMSIGMNFVYGDFVYYTAGDMQAIVKTSDGRRIDLERDMALACRRVDVAKMNHHGHEAMPSELVAKLRPRVYLAAVWNQLQLSRRTMDNVADSSLHDEPPTLMPCVIPEKRRTADAGRPWLKLAERAFDGGAHAVVDVPPGGKTYSVSAVSAADESMSVLSTRQFQSHAIRKTKS